MTQSKSRIHADPAIFFFDEDQEDQFDRLPDPLIVVILNKLSDVRSLGRCLAVSRRFNSLVPMVTDIFVRIDRVVTSDGPGCAGDSDETLTLTSTKPRSLFSHFLKLMLFTILKPLNHLHGGVSGPNRPLLPQLSHHSPVQVLKNFTNVENLRIELPAGDVGTEEGVILKWRAEFGSTLQNCVILGGTRMDHKPAPDNATITSSLSPEENNGSIPESFYTNGGLKLRVVWTISSLIAASTRHYLLRQIIKEHPTLKSLVLTDADGQGTLIMGKEQLKEFREKPLAPSASSSRTQVPASNMKLRYAPYLELPGGVGIQGATLVTIRPATDGNANSGNGNNGNGKKDSEAFVSGSFEGAYKDAVKALLKRRTYLLEMNGF
ncbi:F-box protein [Rhynchospora pubera]|uniref:F-box protein n=1 Tax=Rhynchospora pubera TaxID=906938 RepID=A0AAV8ELH4_9POAL|nr:F-box protein [Rhynchospora pubera]